MAHLSKWKNSGDFCSRKTYPISIHIPKNYDGTSGIELSCYVSVTYNKGGSARGSLPFEPSLAQKQHFLTW